MAKATGLLLPPYRRGGNSIQVDDDKMPSVQFKTFCIFASSIQFLLEPSTKNAKKINNLSKSYLIYSLNVLLQGNLRTDRMRQRPSLGSFYLFR